MREWVTADASIHLCYHLVCTEGLQYAIYSSRARARSDEHSLQKMLHHKQKPPSPALLWDASPRGSSKPLNTLWYKGNSILQIDILRPGDNHWLHKLTLGVKHFIRMRTLSFRLLSPHSLTPHPRCVELGTRVWSKGSLMLTQWLEMLTLYHWLDVIGMSYPHLPADVPGSPWGQTCVGVTIPSSCVSQFRATGWLAEERSADSSAWGKLQVWQGV